MRLPFSRPLIGVFPRHVDHEGCYIGSSLLFVKYLEGKPAAAKLLETGVFALTRALFIGALGAVAALVGSAFLDLQRSFWILLGTAYVLLGALYPASVAQGFWVMAIFGLALSIPLAAAVFWGRARGSLDRLAGLSTRIPFWTGVVFVLLGLWSVYFGVTA